jgi:hypothetical protein
MAKEPKKTKLLDASYNTMQQDLFESGLAAEIGGNAFMLWNAIKTHADRETGICWPGVRRLAEMTGASLGAISKYIEVLEAKKLLRVTRGEKGRGNAYVARERMDVRLGSRVLCTIVIDYVPDKLPEQIQAIEKAVNGKTDPRAFVECEIIPGSGFSWDAETGTLRAEIPSSDVPKRGFLDGQQPPPSAGEQPRLL